jgi:hypothetical protein
MGKGYIAGGDYVGMVLPVKSHISTGGVDYFEADTPDEIRTFALAQLSGTGNVFQMVYLGFTEHFSGGNPPGGNSDSDEGPGGAGKGPGQGPASPQNQPQAPGPQVPSTVKSADLFTNDLGVVTQTMTLQSTDQLATVSVGQGVTAFDAAGNPLSSVSIDVVQADQIAGMPSSGKLSFAGLAYNLQPDGATFSPGITITFTVPQAQWSHQYMIREYDHGADTWIDLPTTYNPESGTVSASVNRFCCFALFSDVAPTIQTRTMAPAPSPAPVATLPSSNAMGIFANMMFWIADVLVKNVLVVAVAVVALCAFFLRGRKKRRDRIRYNL